MCSGVLFGGRGRHGSRFPQLDLVREAGARRTVRLHTGAPIATVRRAAPARCGAFADARRIVGGDEGGRVRTRNCPLGQIAVFRMRSVICGTYIWLYGQP
jgi:hypothetical protein